YSATCCCLPPSSISACSLWGQCSQGLASRRSSVAKAAIAEQQDHIYTQALPKLAVQRMKHILMFVNNPARDDPRVMPEAISLVRAGYAVTVIGLALT